MAAVTASMAALGSAFAFGGLAPTPPPAGRAPQLRGGVAAEQAERAGASVSWTVGMVASSAIAVAAVATRSSRRRPTARWVAAAAEETETAVAEAPPAEPAAAKAAEAPPPFDPSKQTGVTLPLMYFDPAGFCKVGDEEGFRKYRSAELKHGRVAMLAALGCVVQHNIKFPGFGDVPSGIKALTTPQGLVGFLLIVGVSGYMETQVWVQDDKKEPGDFGDPAGIGQNLPEWKDRELNNGRMAMISIMGILVAELVTGKDGVEQIFGSQLGNLPVE